MFSTNKTTQLQKQSSDAIGIFKTTVDKLLTTNVQVRQEKAKKLEEIQAKQDEVKILEGIETQNETFVSKINDFLGIKTED